MRSALAAGAVSEARRSCSSRSFVVLVGMAALAIDGSRAYALRRDLQAAVDAAALAAADNLQRTGSYSLAEQAATASFGANRRLYSAPGCAPGYGAPGAAPRTITCTYADGTKLTQVVSDRGAAGAQFTLSASAALQLQFARILTNRATLNLSSVASSNVNNLLFTPTLAALDQAGWGDHPRGGRLLHPQWRVPQRLDRRRQFRLQRLPVQLDDGL